ncbi:MAG TPA: ABC transporter permease [Syntrophales bacterium]|nr:ABC transporter permease [Syntrophales bacterium]
MRLRNIQAVTRKEFYHLIRDFRSLYLAFALPLLLILLFGYALSLDVDNVETVVVDHDDTDLSREFILHLGGSPYFHVAAHLPNVKTATDYLDRGKAILAIIIPPNWTRDIRSDRAAPLQFLLDGSDPSFANITRGYVNAYVSQYNQKLLISFLNRQGREQINPPVSGQIRVWFNEDLESRNFIVPGIIAVIIMIVGAILTSLVIAREYENGTMETIKSLPLTAGEFLIGKAIPYFFVGLTDVLISILMGQVLFGVVMKSSFWLMILASSIYLSVALTLGLFISCITKNQLLANQGAILLTYLPSLLLSNFVFPVENMPKVLQIVTYIVPATYYVNILSGLYLRNLGLAHLWQSYMVMFFMFAILAALNYVLLKREGL